MASKRYKITPYSPPANGLPELNAKDFERSDESDDAQFYSDARFVAHIDEGAIEGLSRYYGEVIPDPDGAAPSDSTSATSPSSGAAASTQGPPLILDLCSSWISHYPSRVKKQVQDGKLEVLGQGMNAAELKKNPLLTPPHSSSPQRWIVHDLNTNPSISAVLSRLQIPSTRKLSTSTLTVSIDYLTRPVTVLESLESVTQEGGTVHLAVSNRCFPTKAVKRWMHADEDTRLKMCCEDLWRAGWRDVEVVEVTDGSMESSQGGEERRGGGGGLKAFMASLGLPAGGDPLWVVRGRKAER
ncbi:MAG: hypothetical protein Q9159_004833 [Coniocarpon cinnabarinum]